MIETKDLKENEPRLLAVDNELVVPVNKVVKVMITANDVLHAWALPSFGVKRDAVPGRINETWFKAEKVGTYYCLLYTSPSPRDRTRSRMPSSA